MNRWDPTIEDSYQKTLKINNDVVQLDILDTAGQGLFFYYLQFLQFC